jgi:hypothetical protein
MRKTVASSIAALSAAALTIGLAGPANAELYGIDDPRDTSHGSDLLAVQIKNGDYNLFVTTTHTNLRRDWRSGSSGAVFIDTDPHDKGPEYVFVGGYFEASDYALIHAEGFGRKQWGRVVRPGSYQMTIDYNREEVQMRMSRKSIGSAGKIRIAVKVAGTRSDGTSDGLVDWLGAEPRTFTPWIAKGY